MNASTNGHSLPEQPFTADTFAALAPLHLPTYREMRYIGDGLRVALTDFAEADVALVLRLYSVLADIRDLAQQHWDDPEAGVSAIQQFAQDMNWTAFLGAVKRLGHATYDGPHADGINKVIHDIRGGSFLALSIYLQLVEMGFESESDLARLFFLSRDHLKIMRNAISDIDPERQMLDHTQKDHHIDLLTEKWRGATHIVAERQAFIQFDCRYTGVIAERCLEFSALDRVLYNLVNNAVKYTADDQVHIAIFALPDGTGNNLRFVVSNRMHAEQQQVLHERYGDKLGELFRGGFTTGGSGLGLSICAEFVNNAYGVPSFDQGLAGGYFGARQIDDYFVSWFHWPIVAD